MKSISDNNRNYLITRKPLVGGFVLVFILLLITSVCPLSRLHLSRDLKSGKTFKIKYLEDNNQSILQQQYLLFSNITPLFFKTPLNYQPSVAPFLEVSKSISVDPVSLPLKFDENAFGVDSNLVNPAQVDLYACLIDDHYWDFLSLFGKDLLPTKDTGQRPPSNCRMTNLQVKGIHTHVPIKVENAKNSYWEQPLEFCVFVDNSGLITPLLKTKSSGQEKIDNAVQPQIEHFLSVSPLPPNYYILQITP